MKIYFATKDAIWGRFTEHLGYWQGISFAKYLLHNNTSVNEFTVTVFEPDEPTQEYTVQEYVDKLGKEEN